MKAVTVLCLAALCGIASAHKDFEDIDSILSQREEVEPQLETLTNYP